MCDLRLSISANLWGNEACKRVPPEQRQHIAPISTIECVSVCVCVGMGRATRGKEQGVKGTMNVKKKRGSEDGRRASKQEKWENSATASEAHQTVWFSVICWLAKAPSIPVMLKKKDFYSSRHIFIPPLLSHFTWAADALIVLALQGSLFTCSW